MFLSGVVVATEDAAENDEFAVVSNFKALTGVGEESFLHPAKRAAAVASAHKGLLKRVFRVVFCVIDFYCFQL